MAFLRVFLAVIAATTLARANVVDLTNDNFDKFVDGSKAAFVEFYAPWCGHCKRLAPAYEEVGKAFANSPDVLIAKVDADADRALGGRFGVQGFPTLKFFPKGSTTPEDYNGGRTAEDIIGFINEKSGAHGHLKKEASNVVDLTPSNFDSVVMDSQKDVLVEFYAPWCGHCKSLIPVYEELANTFQNEENCVIAKVDADGNREIASKYGVSGYPTIKYFDSDNKTPEDYSGGRDIDSFVKFMNGKCGTNRIKGGSLGPEAGLVDEMNDLAKKFMQDADSRTDTLTEAQKIAEGIGDPHAAYYVKVMTKVQEKGDEFVKNENNRLGRMMEGGAVSSKKSDEFTKRRNVLNKFEL